MEVGGRERWNGYLEMKTIPRRGAMVDKGATGVSDGIRIRSCCLNPRITLGAQCVSAQITLCSPLKKECY